MILVVLTWLRLADKIYWMNFLKRRKVIDTVLFSGKFKKRQIPVWKNEILYQHACYVISCEVELHMNSEHFLFCLALSSII